MNWGRIPSRGFKASFVFYSMAIFFLILVMLDFRGSPTFSDGNKSAAHTIILLDTSLSMLAEDIEPNRMKSAIIHLKHFIKKSKDHIFELHVFSDMHKRVLAFTEDKNLLQTRIEALSSLGAVGGGSDIGVSIKAALASFKSNGINNGNILLVSDVDFQDLTGISTLEKQKNFNLAVLQIGRSGNGAKIPIRTRDGRLRFNKRSGGKEVVSKPNPEFYDRISKKFSNMEKFIISGFNFNSLKMLSFFESNKEDQSETLKYLSRPIFAPYLFLCFFICMLFFLYHEVREKFFRCEDVNFICFLINE